LRQTFPAGGTAAPEGLRARTRASGSTGSSSLRVFVGVILAGQLIGGAIGIAILARGPAAEAATLGQAVPTSFGVVSVDQVELIAASNPDRATLVPGLNEVQVALTMTNLLHRPLRYSRDQISLREGRNGQPVPVSTASIVAGKLKGGTAFRTVYRFVVPSATSELWIRFDDPGRKTPLWIDLGSGPIPVGLSSAYNARLHAYYPHPHGVGR
jgi:hypothetical protein